MKATKNNTILWIDDDHRNLLYEAELIGNLGFEVIFASTIRGAIRLLKEKPFKGIILDIGLPDEYDELSRFSNLCNHAGLFFLKEIFRGELIELEEKAQKISELPLLIHTGYNEHYIRQKIKEFQNENSKLSFAQKPIDECSLEKWVRGLW